MKRFLIYTKVLPLAGIIFTAGPFCAGPRKQQHAVRFEKETRGPSHQKIFRQKTVFHTGIKESGGEKYREAREFIQNHHCS